MGDLVKRHARLARVKKHVTPHVWRHTCATHLVKNNANLRHVQDLLGHGSLATTERYLRLTIADLKAAHARFHPREKSLKKGLVPRRPKRRTIGPVQGTVPASSFSCCRRPPGTTARTPRLSPARPLPKRFPKNALLRKTGVFA